MNIKKRLNSCLTLKNDIEREDLYINLLHSKYAIRGRMYIEEFLNVTFDMYSWN